MVQQGAVGSTAPRAVGGWCPVSRFGGFSVMFRLCLCHALAVSWSCFAGVLVKFRCCFGGVLPMLLLCLVSVLMCVWTLRSRFYRPGAYCGLALAKPDCAWTHLFQTLLVGWQKSDQVEYMTTILFCQKRWMDKKIRTIGDRCSEMSCLRDCSLSSLHKTNTLIS